MTLTDSADEGESSAEEDIEEGAEVNSVLAITEEGSLLLESV